jgi:hypothetical protein
MKAKTLAKGAVKSAPTKKSAPKKASKAVAKKGSTK